MTFVPFDWENIDPSKVEITDGIREFHGKIRNLFGDDPYLIRPATVDDEEVLWRWRRESERRGQRDGWYEGRTTSRAAHHRWFRTCINHLQILIWERGGMRLGYVRIDSNGELSFYPHTMAAVPMLKATWAYADRYGGRLKATVDEANKPAVKALEAAGFAQVPVSFHVYRP